MADIVCPNCSTQYRISDSKLGTASKLCCKKCNTVFQLQDNIKTEEPPPAETSASEANTLEFDLSNIQFNYPETDSTSNDEALEEPQDIAASQENDFLDDMNFGDIALGFGTSEEADSSSTLSMPDGFNFSQGTEEEEIQDHISAPFKSDSEQEESPFSEFSLVGGNDEQDLSEAPTLDFSFSAAAPEAPPEDENEDQEWDDDQNWDEDEVEQPETMDAAGSQNLGLDLGQVSFGDEEDDAEESVEEEETEEPPAEEEFEEEEYEEEAIEEDLSNCCIDSLAMGLPRCELCGRDLAGQDQHYAQELQKLRREQLREELIAGEAQIGFSEERAAGAHETAPLHTVEDFSDVEQALDALADGTFHQKAKKREAKKNFANTLKTLVGAAVAVIVLIGIIFIFLLPSKTEKLDTRYEEFMAQGGEDSKMLAQLFLDSSVEKYEALFRKLSVLETIPAYKSGKVISVGERDEEASLGTPGKLLVDLEADLAMLDQQVAEKTALLEEYSSKNLSPKLLEQRIKQSENKITDLTEEFEEKDAEISKKLRRLRRELTETDDDIAEQRRIARKHIDSTDQVGKALYENSISKQKYLNDQKVKLVRQVQKEETRYQRLRQELDKEYQPEFARLEERLATEQALLKEAKWLNDKERSPVVTLRKELNQMTQETIDKKALLEKTRIEFNQVLDFFDTQGKQQIATRQQEAELSHITQYVAANVTTESGSARQISLVLKRYLAAFPDKTLQSNWQVEKSVE